jgi:L-methionine (R)-S-oxide reductase
MITPETARTALQRLEVSANTGPDFRREAMSVLSELPGYNWSGIYRLQGDELLLDEYVGAETDHTRIAVGVGVCGTAVLEDRNQVVEDVRQLNNYLACSLQTRSEIVVLIRREDKVIGQIDIDGHEVASFDKSDEAFLEQLANLIADRW